VLKTNTYAAQKIQARSFIPLHSRMWDWKPVTKDEIYVVFTLFMLMGTIQKPTLHSYFSKNYILATPIFDSIISMDQFESICSLMHFNNNDHTGTYQRPSKLFKTYPVLSHLNIKIQILYLPGQNIAIYESLTLRRGRLSFRQYIPLKSSKFGILYNLYWQRHCVPDSIHFMQHKQNSSNCVVTCEAIAGKGLHIVDGQFL